MSITINAPRSTYGVLRAKWHAAISSAELPTSFELLLDHAVKSGNCRFWLLDLSQCNWSEPPFMTWLAQQFAAQATQLLGGPIFAAYLGASHQVVHSKNTCAATTQCQAAEANFYSSFFENAALAIDWLRDQQELEPTSADLFSLVTRATK